MVDRKIEQCFLAPFLKIVEATAPRLALGYTWLNTRCDAPPQLMDKSKHGSWQATAVRLREQIKRSNYVDDGCRHPVPTTRSLEPVLSVKDKPLWPPRQSCSAGPLAAILEACSEVSTEQVKGREKVYALNRIHLVH